VNRSISDIYRKHKQIFPHSHTHSCNTLAAAVAVDYLSLLQNSNVLANVRVAETILIEFNTKLKQRFTFISKARAIGAIAAWELNLPPKQIQLVVSLAKDLEIHLRPIGNIVYLLPPIYNILEDLRLLLPKIEITFENLTTYEL
jgi:adenosylmethionine-8-amino-7-oxononanoate aminotransferase